jgi:hypothetical protein
MSSGIKPCANKASRTVSISAKFEFRLVVSNDTNFSNQSRVFMMVNSFLTNERIPGIQDEFLQKIV